MNDYKRRIAMKSLVVYSSQTGNTKKLAQTIFENLQGEKEIHPAASAPDPADYDLVAVGFWLMGGGPDPVAQKYLSKIGSQKLFLFATHGVAKDSPEALNSMNMAKNMAKKANVIGTFSCQGQLSAPTLEMTKKQPNLPDWLKEHTAEGHPDVKDLDELKEVLNKVV